MKLDVERVLEMLRDTDMMVKDIAAAFGCTPAAVTHAVKKRTGMLPSDYRHSFGWSKGLRGLSPGQIVEVVRLYQSGLSVTQISESFGSRPRIAQVLRDCGYTLRDAGAYTAIQLPEVEIAQRYRAGESAVSLAAAFGVSERTVRRALDRQHCPRRSHRDAANLTAV